MILGSDVLYEARNHDSNLDVLSTMLSSGGVCWLGDTGPPLASRFCGLASARGFTVELRTEHGEPLDKPGIGRFQLLVVRFAPERLADHSAAK